MQNTAIVQLNTEVLPEQQDSIVQTLVELNDWAKRYYKLQEETFCLELIDIDA